jgi:hypothetical protein
VVIEGGDVASEDLLCALADFAFHEGQLRLLESSISPIEAAAPQDAPRAYVIRSEDNFHWPRFHESIERLSALRLAAARLEPCLYLRPRTLPGASQRLIARLRARADIESRLEALSDRLEACEDLYEGAVDRVTDHRWYRRGFWLEIAIVALLLLEVIQIAASLILHGPAGK